MIEAKLKPNAIGWAWLNQTKQYKVKKNYNFSQGELAYVYEGAKARMKYHPDIAEKYRKIIQNHPYFKTLDDAIRYAKSVDEERADWCQIWAKVDKNEEYYYIQDYFIASDDISILIAAEYIGFEQMRLDM